MEINYKNPGQLAIDSRRIVSKGLSEATQRLGSGYRINSAADDAAGLAVSEKMRSIDRGLRQGVRNLSDGLNYIDTVDGCTQEINDILHRLKELAVESANGTYSKMDRGALDLEYQQLLDEITQMTDTSVFNTVPLFDKHQAVYTFMPGNVVHNEPVVIDSSNDLLVVDYSLEGVPLSLSINIPHGTFPADELADKIDDYLYDKEPNLIIGVNENNQFTLQAENGHIDTIYGSGATLFYDLRVGAKTGYLMGMTKFSEGAKLNIIPGYNNEVCFRYGNVDDTLHRITLDRGSYSRSELIAHMNEKFAEAGFGGEIEALPDKDHDGNDIIAIRGEKPFTGLAGNFLMIDDKSSPLFDICNYSTRENSKSTLDGKALLTGGVEIVKGINDYFVLDVGYYTGENQSVHKKMRFDLLDDADNGRKTYASGAEVVKRIQDKFDSEDVPIDVKLDDKGTLYFETRQYGKECNVRLDRTDVPSQHMVFDLFDRGTLRALRPMPSASSFAPASFWTQQDLTSGVRLDDRHNVLSFNIITDNGTERLDITLDARRYSSANDVLTELKNKLAASNIPSKDNIEFSLDHGKIVLKGKGIQSKIVRSINVDESCSAYHKLIRGARFFDRMQSSGGSEMALKVESQNAPNSRNPNITYTPGRSSGDWYSPYNPSTTEYKEGDYMEFKDASVKTDPGDDGTKFEDIVGTAPNAKPATATIANVGSQFFNDGRCTRDLELKFTLTDELSDKHSYSIKFDKGSTLEDCVKRINSNLGDTVTAEVNGNNVTITSQARGGAIQFGDFGGSFVQTAQKTDVGGNPNAHIDKANNKAWAGASTTYSGAGSHFSGGSGFTVNEFNDEMTVAAGDKSVTFKLAHKTYSSLDDLASEIRGHLGGSGFSVEASGNSLIFGGDNTVSGTIGIYGTTELDKMRYTGSGDSPASVNIAGVSTNLPITIKSDGSNNTISMDYKTPGGGSERLTITLPANGRTYSDMSAFEGAIYSAIQNDANLKNKIRVSTNGTGLTFTTVNSGAGYVLSNFGGTLDLSKTIVTNNPPDKAKEDPDQNKLYTSATLSNDKFDTLFTDGGLEIDDDNKNVAFSITHNGSTVNCEFELDKKIYSSPSLLISEVNSKINASNAKGMVRAEVIGGVFRLKTLDDVSGNGTSLRLRQPPNTSPLFREKRVSDPWDHSSRVAPKCCITGTQDITGEIEIGDWNNTMTFDYTTDSGNTSRATVTLDNGTYNLNSIKSELQDKIDKAIGADQLTVKTTYGNRLQLEASDMSERRGINNFEGQLFKKLFQGSLYNGIYRAQHVAGTTKGEVLAYIFGNNPMEPRTQEEIEADKNLNVELGVNDELRFDFTYNGLHTINITFPEGLYTREQIASEIQRQTREQIKDILDYDGEPLEVERFRATIGGGELGLNESGEIAMDRSDKLYLSFKEYSDGSVEHSDALINGIRGSAAYRIFYETTKVPSPSRAIGGADLRDGVEILSGVNDEFGFRLDGEETMIKIPAGHYSAEGISEYLTKTLENMGSVVRTHITKDGYLMLYTAENGEFDLGRVRGSGANDLFYNGRSRDKDEEGPGIHYGRRTNSYIWIKKSRLDAHLMRINTTGVTTVERALKAIDRLDGANEYLLKYRAQHGAYENRIERTRERNTVQIENLDASESDIRDADIPQEIAKLNKQTILGQIQEFMMKQEQGLAQNIVSILDQRG